jgi:hypothetical protein
MLARIRKAVVGGLLAGLGTGISWLSKAGLDGSVNGDDVGQALGAASAAALATLSAVYATRNGGGTNTVGSDPAGGSSLLR